MFQDLGVIRAVELKKPKRPVETTRIIVDRVSSFEEGIELVRDLAKILSLASLNRVVATELKAGDHWQHISMIEIGARSFRPLIEIADGAKIIDFVQQTFLPFRKFRKERNVDLSIEYIITAETSVVPVEAEYLLLCTALEHMKYNWAIANDIEFRNGNFWIYGRRASFRDLVTLMLDDVGCMRQLSSLKHRNPIVHTGLFVPGTEQFIKDRDALMDLLLEYLIRLLEYTGEYLLYREAANRPAQIEE